MNLDCRENRGRKVGFCGRTSSLKKCYINGILKEYPVNFPPVQQVESVPIPRLMQGRRRSGR